jgi:hypothetical protein
MELWLVTITINSDAWNEEWISMDIRVHEPLVIEMNRT